MSTMIEVRRQTRRAMLTAGLITLLNIMLSVDNPNGPSSIIAVLGIIWLMVGGTAYLASTSQIHEQITTRGNTEFLAMQQRMAARGLRFRTREEIDADVQLALVRA